MRYTTACCMISHCKTMWRWQQAWTARCVWGPVQRLAMILTVLGSKPGWGKKFSILHTRPDKLLVSSGANFPGVKRSEHGAEQRPHPTPMLRMNRFLLLLSICACTACYSDTPTVLVTVSSLLYDVTIVKVFLPLVQTLKQVRMRLNLHTRTPSSRVRTRPKPSDISGRKNPHHAFLRKGSKAVCPMSHICCM